MGIHKVQPDQNRRIWQRSGIGLNVENKEKLAVKLKVLLNHIIVNYKVVNFENPVKGVPKLF